jgi:hypothetical protein
MGRIIVEMLAESEGSMSIIFRYQDHENYYSFDVLGDREKTCLLL